MNKVDKLCRDSKIIVDSVKDTLDSNILAAYQDKSLGLSESQLQNILALVAASVSEGFSRSVPTFARKVTDTLNAG
jgi:hypothetical protein